MEKIIELDFLAMDGTGSQLTKDANLIHLKLTQSQFVCLAHTVNARLTSEYVLESLDARRNE